MAKKKKILVFQHVAREHPSRIQMYAFTRGLGLDTVRLWESYTMPSLADYDALIILGGPQSVHQGFPSMHDELAVLHDVVGKMPVLGICLGGQLLAKSLGADVHEHIVDGKLVKEVGHYPITLTEEGRKHGLFKGFPKIFTVLQWHGDTFDIPKGATHLAEGEKCENQAFAYQNAYGIQFHFEHSPYALAHQVDKFGDWARTGFDFDEKKIVDEAFALDKEMTEHCERLMDNFLKE